MKNILIPIDFSPVSIQSAEYAVHVFSKYSDMHLTFYHTYFLMDIDSALLDVATDAELQMNSFLEKVVSKYPGISYSVVVNDLQLLVGIKDIISKSDISMIVMGINGKGKLSQKVFGSNTIAMVHETDIPVLVIPKDVPLEEVQSVLMAIPYKDDLKNFIPIEHIKSLIETYNLKLKIATINKNTSAFETLNILTSQDEIVSQLENLNPEYFKLDGQHVANSLIEFSNQENCQWICTISEEHNLWHRLISGSVTTDLVYNSNKPILIYNSL